MMAVDDGEPVMFVPHVGVFDLALEGAPARLGASAREVRAGITREAQGLETGGWEDGERNDSGSRA